MKNNSNILTNKGIGKWPIIGVAFYLSLVVMSIIFDSDSWSSVLNIEQNYLRPFINVHHWLGTDGLGRDVWAGILNGAKISFIISVTTSIIALLIGFSLGYLSGYIGNGRIRTHYTLLFIYFILTLLWVFYSYHEELWLLFFVVLIGVISLIHFINQSFNLLKANVGIPMDDIIMKLIEFSRSISGIFILIFCLAIFDDRSILNVIIVISLVRWQKLTRYIRAEFLKIKNSDYIKNVDALGVPSIKILFRHLLPNIYRPILTVLVYGFSVTILLEATISFIGIGLPVETVSWGSMLSESRSYFQAWWLAIFPGLMIFIITLSLRKLINDSEDDWSYL